MAITTPAGSSRRDFIRLTGTLGMAAGLAVSLAACGGKAKTRAARRAVARPPTRRSLTRMVLSPQVFPMSWAPMATIR